MLTYQFAVTFLAGEYSNIYIQNLLNTFAGDISNFTVALIINIVFLIAFSIFILCGYNILIRKIINHTKGGGFLCLIT